MSESDSDVKKYEQLFKDLGYDIVDTIIDIKDDNSS